MNIVESYRLASKQLNDAVSQTPQRINQLNTLIQRADLEEQDLLHLAEFYNFNASEGYKIAKRLQKVRKRRRGYKNELEVLHELKKVANNNSKLQSHVSLLNKSIKNQEDRIASKKYEVRVCADLVDKFDKINRKMGQQYEL